MIDKNLLSPDERATAEWLEAAAAQINATPSFKAELENKLMNSQPSKSGFGLFAVKTLVPALGWTLGLVVMALVFNWIIGSIAPTSQPAAGNTPFPNVETATPATTNEYTVKNGDSCGKIAYDFGITVDELIASNNLVPGCVNLTVGQILKIPAHGTGPTPQGEAYDWNGNKLYLNAPLPDAPIEANIYLAQADQHATIESARALAQRFGIEGQVYEVTGEVPGTTDYMVTAGGPRITVRSDNYFYYVVNYGGTYVGGKNLTDEQAAAAIDTFLKSHGFNFEYQIRHAPQIYGEYYVIPQLDGLSLHHDYDIPAHLDIVVDDNGQVLSVYSALLSAQPVGAYGIRSAEEAFQQILNNAQVGVEQSMRGGGMLDMQIWPREYPDNQPVTLYGEVTVFKPAETGQPPLVTITTNNWPVTGNAAGLEAVQAGVTIEANGQFVTENGIRVFQVDSWKDSDAEMTSLSGVLHKDGDQVTLVADGNEYSLADAPADVPLNTQPLDQALILSGILVNGQLEWTMIQYFPTNSGGGGGGGNSDFYKLNLTGTPMPLPTLEPTAQSTDGTSPTYTAIGYAVQAGDSINSIADANGITPEELMKANGMTDPSTLAIGQTLVIPSGLASTPQTVEGQRRLLTVTIYKQADGGQRVEYGFVSNDPTSPFMLGEGENLEGLQSYQNRPVDIWGTIDHVNDNGIPVVKVDRYEIPFPGLQFQVLKGTEKTINIQDQTALLFTSEDGKSYVQLAPNCSDVIGPDSVVGTGQIGELLLLEALVVPDLTFGDYPAICVFNTSMAVNPKNGQPMELTVTADQPYVADELAGENMTGAPASTMTIEKVELVYYISDPRFAVTDPTAGPPYIQPMWRFSGHYSNGDTFEFLVQALKDEFLSPEIQTIQGPG